MVRKFRLFVGIFCLGMVGIGLARAAHKHKTPAKESTVEILCSELEKSFEKRNWGKPDCKSLDWIVKGRSVLGRPLVVGEFGDPAAKNTTLFLSMVHGDEITPLYLGFEMIRWAKENMPRLKDTRLIIAPLVNPDGFFETPKTRTNANGVDCNRNFGTKDWTSQALRQWKTRFRSEPRRFPGKRPDSEPETLFQRELITSYAPTKILSVHSPLNFIDYDGPDHMSLDQFPKDYVKNCVELRKKIRARSGGFFPGSLGNYAGQELGIPTFTIELPTAQYEKAKKYWEDFRRGIETVVKYEVKE